MRTPPRFAFWLLFAFLVPIRPGAAEVARVAPNDTLPSSYSLDTPSGQYDYVWTQISCLTTGISATMRMNMAYHETEWRPGAQIILNIVRPGSGTDKSTDAAAVLEISKAGVFAAHAMKVHSDGQRELHAFRTAVEMKRDVTFALSWTATGAVTIQGPGNERLFVDIGEPVTSIALTNSGSQVNFTHVMLHKTKKDACAVS